MSERLRCLVCSICDYRKTHKKNVRHPLPDMLILSGIDKFRGVCAVVEVTTHTTYKATGKETSQTRYYITSLRGSAQLMDYISRKHWGIENNLHWELDTFLRVQRYKQTRTRKIRLKWDGYG